MSLSCWAKCLTLLTLADDVGPSPVTRYTLATMMPPRCTADQCLITSRPGIEEASPPFWPKWTLASPRWEGVAMPTPPRGACWQVRARLLHRDSGSFQRSLPLHRPGPLFLNWNSCRCKVMLLHKDQVSLQGLPVEEDTEGPPGGAIDCVNGQAATLKA